MRKSRTNRRTIKKQNRKQKGGKIVMPMRYFNDSHTAHYNANPTIAAGQIATSHGVPISGQNMVGPDLRIASLTKQQGGGVLPGEYFGGNSGRYFEEGAPELANCESAYGTIIPTSHGVVMGGENSQWMGPNLASFPNSTKLQTGGGCPKCGYKRTLKRGGGKKSKRSSKRSRSKRSSSRRSSSKRSRKNKRGGAKHNCKCGVKCNCGKLCKCKKGCKGCKKVVKGNCVNCKKQ